jgi:hypothetical protein
MKFVSSRDRTSIVTEGVLALGKLRRFVIWYLLARQYKFSSKFQFFNPHRQAVDLIGFFSISSLPAIEESGPTQGHDAD